MGRYHTIQDNCLKEVLTSRLYACYGRSCGCPPPVHLALAVQYHCDMEGRPTAWQHFYSDSKHQLEEQLCSSTLKRLQVLLHFCVLQSACASST